MTVLRAPRPGWTSQCACGKLHRYKNPDGGGGVVNARWIVEAEATDEYPEYGHWECRNCRREVHPETYSPPYPVAIPGLMHYSIDGEPVTEEDYRRELTIEERRWRARKKK